MVPYDCIREYLETHPMIQSLGVSARDVHSALTVLADTFVVTEPEPPPSARPEKRVRCTDCSSVNVILDEHEGVNVCDDCGVVQTRRSINVVHEYVAPVAEAQLAPR